jgi:hypothetical protein
VVAFLYVCPRHRDLFVARVAREGCRDAAAIEQARRLLLGWLSQTYPRLVLDSYNAKSCLGCGLDDACVDLTDMYAALRRFAREAAQAA